MKPFYFIAFLCSFALTVEHFISAGRVENINRSMRAADLSILPSESKVSYSARMTRLVAQSSDYCTKPDAEFSMIERAGAALAPKQLFVHGVLIRDKFTCGACATKSAILRDILSDKGISSNLYFTQHVILRSGDMYFDPTFGIGPFKLADYREVYKAIPPLSETESWEYVFTHPSATAEEQGRWNAIVEVEKYMQSIFFKLANAVALFTGLLGCVFLWLALRGREYRNWQRTAPLGHLIRVKRQLRSWVRT